MITAYFIYDTPSKLLTEYNAISNYVMFRVEAYEIM